MGWAQKVKAAIDWIRENVDPDKIDASLAYLSKILAWLGAFGSGPATSALDRQEQVLAFRAEAKALDLAPEPFEDLLAA